MSDPLCVGVCMNDPESGVCLGCGRTPEEIARAGEPTTEASGANGLTGMPTRVAADSVASADGADSTASPAAAICKNSGAMPVATAAAADLAG